MRTSNLSLRRIRLFGPRTKASVGGFNLNLRPVPPPVAPRTRDARWAPREPTSASRPQSDILGTQAAQSCTTISPSLQTSLFLSLSHTHQAVRTVRALVISLHSPWLCPVQKQSASGGQQMSRVRPRSRRRTSSGMRLRWAGSGDTRACCRTRLEGEHRNCCSECDDTSTTIAAGLPRATGDCRDADTPGNGMAPSCRLCRSRSVS